jgi:hypothetical protein
MAYSAEISRQNPSCILFLIDQSGSMSDPFGGAPGRSKAEKLADAVNRLIFELTIRCTRDQSDGVNNYYDVGVLGYGAQIGSVFGGSLTGREIVPLRDVADNPMLVDERRRRVEDGTGGLVEETVRFPIWFQPVANGSTPMCQALTLAQNLLSGWVQTHNNSFPPIVINITDGESTDGSPLHPSDALRSLSTDDGNVLLFNLHLSSQAGEPILYPDSDAKLPDQYARQLFAMSSLLPPHIRDAAGSEGYQVGSGAHGFVFNADIVEVIKFLDIGTRAKAMR